MNITCGVFFTSVLIRRLFAEFINAARIDLDPMPTLMAHNKSQPVGLVVPCNPPIVYTAGLLAEETPDVFS